VSGLTSLATGLDNGVAFGIPTKGSRRLLNIASTDKKMSPENASPADVSKDTEHMSEKFPEKIVAENHEENKETANMSEKSTEKSLDETDTAVEKPDEKSSEKDNLETDTDKEKTEHPSEKENEKPPRETDEAIEEELDETDDDNEERLKWLEERLAETDEDNERDSNGWKNKNSYFHWQKENQKQSLRIGNSSFKRRTAKRITRSGWKKW